MLILTRNIEETIVIGKDITITVLGIKGQQCRLGITAPRDTRVDREEVSLRRQAEGWDDTGSHE